MLDISKLTITGLTNSIRRFRFSPSLRIGLEVSLNAPTAGQIIEGLTRMAGVSEPVCSEARAARLPARYFINARRGMFDEMVVLPEPGDLRRNPYDRFVVVHVRQYTKLTFAV